MIHKYLTHKIDSQKETHKNDSQNLDSKKWFTNFKLTKNNHKMETQKNDSQNLVSDIIHKIEETH